MLYKVDYNKQRCMFKRREIDGVEGEYLWDTNVEHKLFACVCECVCVSDCARNHSVKRSEEKESVKSGGIFDDQALFLDSDWGPEGEEVGERMKMKGDAAPLPMHASAPNPC